MEKGSKLFKVSALTAAMFGVLALPVHASSESAAGDQYVETVNEFMKDSALNASVIFDARTVRVIVAWKVMRYGAVLITVHITLFLISHRVIMMAGWVLMLVVTSLVICITQVR